MIVIYLWKHDIYTFLVCGACTYSYSSSSEYCLYMILSGESRINFYHATLNLVSTVKYCMIRLMRCDKRSNLIRDNVIITRSLAGCLPFSVVKTSRLVV